MKLRLALDYGTTEAVARWPGASGYRRCGRNYDLWAVASAWADAACLTGGRIPSGEMFPR